MTIMIEGMLMKGTLLWGDKALLFLPLVHFISYSFTCLESKEKMWDVRILNK